MLTTSFGSCYGSVVLTGFLLLQSLIVCINGDIKGDLFSSREALIELYKSENIAMGLLRTYIDENNVEHDYLQKWDKFIIKLVFLIKNKIIFNGRTLFEFETAQWKALNRPVEYLSNPVNAFMLIKRLTTDWPIVMDITEGLNGGKLIY